MPDEDFVPVPHYEPTSSGVHYEPDKLPEWFQSKVKALAADDACASQRDTMQLCIDKYDWNAKECREVLDLYDECQVRAFAPTYAPRKNAKNLSTQWEG